MILKAFTEYKSRACCQKSYFRSRRHGWWEKLIAIFGFYPFNCDNPTCGQRFYKRSRR